MIPEEEDAFGNRLPFGIWVDQKHADLSWQISHHQKRSPLTPGYYWGQSISRKPVRIGDIVLTNWGPDGAPLVIVANHNFSGIAAYMHLALGEPSNHETPENPV